MKEYSGYAKVWAYWRDDTGQVWDANFNFLGRIVRGFHTLSTFRYGPAYKQGTSTYWTCPWWVTVDDDGNLVDNVSFDAINQEFQGQREISVYVEYMNNSGNPYNNNNQDSRTFGVGKRVVFDVAAWLNIGQG